MGVGIKFEWKGKAMVCVRQSVYPLKKPFICMELHDKTYRRYSFSKQEILDCL